MALPRLRLAAVGCGRVFERLHLPALRRSPHWTLAAAIDRSADRLRWVGRVAPGAALAGSLGDLDAGSLDAALISTPPDTHFTLASEALRRGLHALVEKPMALRPSEAASLVALARDVGRQIWVGFNRRFRPDYLRLRERLQALPPDRLRGVSYELRTAPGRWDAVSGHLDLSEPVGGLLDDIASHQLDLLPLIVSRPIEEVRARFERQDPEALVIAIDLRFAGGIEGRCRAAHGPDSAERLEVRLADRTVRATHGTMTTSTWTPVPLVERYLAGRTALGSVVRRLRGAPGYTPETFDRQFDAWAAALRGGATTSAADGVAGARCVELVEACRQSLAVGGAWMAPPVGTVR